MKRTFTGVLAVCLLLVATLSSAASYILRAPSPGLKAQTTTTAAPAPDPDIANVDLLLYLTGADGSTSFPDSSSQNLAVSGSSVSIKTATSPFDNGSAFFTSGSALNVPYSAGNFAFANGVTTWTVEAWVYLVGSQSSIGTYRLDVAGNQTSCSGWEAAISSGGLTVVYPCYGGPGVAVSISSGAWHHVAWSRSGSDYYFAVDGKVQHSTYSGGGAEAGFMKIGGNLNNTPGIDYYLSNVRITKGVARYTADFTPPSAPFPNN